MYQVLFFKTAVLGVITIQNLGLIIARLDLMHRYVTRFMAAVAAFKCQQSSLFRK